MLAYTSFQYVKYTSKACLSVCIPDYEPGEPDFDGYLSTPEYIKVSRGLPWCKLY